MFFYIFDVSFIPRVIFTLWSHTHCRVSENFLSISFAPLFFMRSFPYIWNRSICLKFVPFKKINNEIVFLVATNGYVVPNFNKRKKSPYEFLCLCILWLLTVFISLGFLCRSSSSRVGVGWPFQITCAHNLLDCIPRTCYFRSIFAHSKRLYSSRIT